MTSKAKKVPYSTMKGTYSTSIEYEYRGKTYWVEYPNSFTYCVTPPHIQHEQAQAEIDKEIEWESRPHNTEDAQVGLDMFFAYVDGEEI